MSEDDDKVNPFSFDRDPAAEPPWWFDIETDPVKGTSSANFRDATIPTAVWLQRFLADRLQP